jgi:hypothetical protein
MLHKGQESAFRKLLWIEAKNFGGWGCSKCAWVFRPSQPPVGNSLDELTTNLQRQLDNAFASHDCAEFSPGKAASA